MTVDGGYFKVARGWMDHPELASSEPFTRREAWLWLIEQAAFADRPKRIGSSVIDLQRGQLTASVRFMAKAWGWEPTRVQRFLKRLKTATMITTETATAQLLITLCNYSVYQGGEQNFATPSATQNATQALQQRHKIEEGNKGKKESTSFGGDLILFPDRASPTLKDDFEEWWQHVPKKVGKANARKAFPAALKKASSFDALLDGISRYAASIQGKDAQFVLHPATWLNGERWNDETASTSVPRSESDLEWEAAKAQGGAAMDEFLKRSTARH